MMSTFQSEVITLFEDRSTMLNDLVAHRENLYSLRDIIGANNFSLQSDGSFRVMHYVGFFQKGKTRVQVLPKVFENTAGLPFELEKKRGLDFVYRMLFRSGFLKGKSLRSQQIGSTDGDLLEIFIQLFVDEFIALFSRRILNSYHERIESQSFVKGKILIADTLRTHPILRHRHVVRFDEFTINNPLNQIFKSLMLQLGSKTNSRESKKKIALGLTYLDDVEDINLSQRHFDSIRFNRLNTDYEPLFNLAKLFFHNQQPGLSQGKEKTLSFLIPINRLFEDFVARILEGFSNAEYTFHHQKNRVNLFSGQLEGGLQLRPDYSVTKGGEVVAIMDAKYKSPYNRSTVDLKESDVYQLCTYALRYKVRKVFLIFPKFQGSPRQETLIGTYKINAVSGEIELKAIQVDVLERDLAVIVSQLREVLGPSRIDPEYSIKQEIRDRHQVSLTNWINENYKTSFDFKDNHQDVWTMVEGAFVVAHTMVNDIARSNKNLPEHEIQVLLFWQTTLEYLMDSFALITQKRFDLGFGTLRLASELVRNSLRILEKPELLELLFDHGEKRERRIRESFKFDTGKQEEKYLFDLYKLCSKYGIHGHMTTDMARELKQVLKDHVVLGISDLEILKMLRIWLRAFFPLQKQYVYYFGERYNPRSGRLYRDMHEQYYIALDAFERNLGTLLNDE